MTTYTLNIIVQGHDRASGPLGAVHGALSGLTGVGQTMLGVFGGGLLLQGFNLLTGAIASMARQSFDAAGSFQMLQIQMQGLIAMQLQATGGFSDMGAAEAAAVDPARALADWIANFAAQTPFTVKSLTEMVRGFLSIGMGVEPSKRLTEALARLAAGMGLTSWQMERVVWNILQTSRSLKITERDIREFGNAGIPVNMVLDMMAEKLGITRQQALEFAKSGEAGVAAWNEALVALADKHFPDALEKIKTTWAVAASNIQDVIESIFGKEVIGPALGSFAEMISGGIDVILAHREDFRSFGELLNGVFLFLADRAGALGAAFGQFTGTLLGLLGIDLSTFNLREFVLAVALALGLALMAGTDFLNWLTVTLPPMLAAGALMFAPVTLGVMDLFTAFQTTLPQIQGFVNTLILGVTTAFATFMPQIAANVGAGLSAIAAFWQAHGAQIMAAVSILWQIITTTIGGALTLITGIISAALQLLSGNWQGAWNTMMASVTTFLSGVLALVGISLDQFLADWSFIIGATLALVVAFFANLLRTVTSGLAAWGADWQLAGQALTALWQRLLAAAQSWIASLIATVLNGILNIISGIQGLIGSFVSLGGQIIEGIKSGIGGAVGGLVQAAVDAAVSAFNAAKNALGIHSPSTLFEGIGEGMMAGMAQGILGAMEAPQLALAQATPAFAGASTSAGRSESAPAGIVIHIYDPVVREEQDIERLAYAVAAELQRKTS